MQFKTQVTYANINNLKPTFWIFFESWCSHLTDESKLVYDSSNHIKIPTRKRNNKHSGNIKAFHRRFTVLSSKRSPLN